MQKLEQQVPGYLIPRRGHPEALKWKGWILSCAGVVGRNVLLPLLVAGVGATVFVETGRQFFTDRSEQTPPTDLVAPEDEELPKAPSASEEEGRPERELRIEDEDE